MHEARRVEQLASVIQDPFTDVVAAFTMGLVLLRRGDAAPAVPLLATAVEGATRAQIQLLLPYAAGHLGVALAYTGQPEAGIELLQRVVTQSEALQLVAHLSRWTSMLGEACLLARRVDDAERHARAALELAHRYGERANEAWALWLLGRVSSAREPRDELYTRAQALASELSLAPLATLIAGADAR